MNIDEIFKKFKNIDKHDKLRGFIVIKENDKIIDTVENMITIKGRQAIMKSFFGKTTNSVPGFMFVDSGSSITNDSSPESCSLENPRFCAVGAVSSSNIITQKPSSDITEENSVGKIVIYENYCYYHIQGTFSFGDEEATQEFNANSIGLSFNDEDEEYDNIFSRAVINKKTFMAGNTYTIDYYFYF